MTERITGDWNSLDPFQLFNQSAAQIAAALYDFLVYWDGTKFIPYLASSWTVTPTQIVFKLRSDATCSDGEKLTPTVIYEQWQKVGLTVLLDKADLATFSTKYRAGDWDAVVYNYTNSSPSLSRAAALFSGALPPAGFNFPRINDTELNSLVAKANSTVGDERCNAWKAVQRLVLQKHYVYAMAGQASYWFARPGFEFAPESAYQVQPVTLRSRVK